MSDFAILLKARARMVRNSIAALRGESVAQTIAMVDAMEARREIARLKREAERTVEEEAGHEVDRAERLPFTPFAQ